MSCHIELCDWFTDLDNKVYIPTHMGNNPLINPDFSKQIVKALHTNTKPPNNHLGTVVDSE